VQQVLLRADGEFLRWPSIAACIEAGFDFIIANKGREPPFDPNSWYRPFKRKHIEYNSCEYQPSGWAVACRFEVMRIPKGLQGIVKNTIRIARLKLLFIAAKVAKDSNVGKVKYSIHDARTPTMINFLNFLYTIRLIIRPWEEDSSWPQQFALQTT
jgi:hypothetical protein